MNEKFKIGFLKSAKEKGYSDEESEQLYISKLAYNQGDYFQNIKDVIRDQGVAPQYNIDDTHPNALNYNNELLKARDEFGREDPNIEGLKSGLGRGALGAVLGAGAGELSGHAANKFINPKYKSLMTKLPRWGKALGIAGGAIAGGLPAFEKARNRVESMKRLNDPRVMQAMLDQLSRERQLANNQLGTYRPIGIEPEGYR